MRAPRGRVFSVNDMEGERRMSPKGLAIVKMIHTYFFLWLLALLQLLPRCSPRQQGSQKVPDKTRSRRRRLRLSNSIELSQSCYRGRVRNRERERFSSRCVADLRAELRELERKPWKRERDVGSRCVADQRPENVVTSLTLFRTHTCLTSAGCSYRHYMNVSYI